MVADDLLHLLFFPKGTILMFSGSEYGRLVNATDVAYKDVWKLCDGQNGTPNLINKFIRAGASSGGTGGNDSVTLTAANIPLPAHSHNLTSITVETTGAHTHTVGGTASNEGGHLHSVTGTVDHGGAHTHYCFSYGQRTFSGDGGKYASLLNDPDVSTIGCSTGGGEHDHGFSNGAASGGGHTHSVTGTADLDGAHTHKITGSTDSYGGAAGSNLVISLVPSYYTLVYIMKVK
jgi:hypothetical protein